MIRRSSEEFDRELRLLSSSFLWKRLYRSYSPLLNQDLLSSYMDFFICVGSAMYGDLS